jgi:hypothetical protein
LLDKSVLLLARGSWSRNAPLSQFQWAGGRVPAFTPCWVGTATSTALLQALMRMLMLMLMLTQILMPSRLYRDTCDMNQ